MANDEPARSPDGLGPAFEGLPLWAKVILLFGFPTFVACFYMAQDMGAIPSVHQQTLRLVQQQTEDMREHRRRQEELIVTLNAALRVLCMNAATDSQGKPLQPGYNNCQNIR